MSSNVAGKSPTTECLSGKIIDFQRVKDAIEGNDKWGWSHCIVCIPKDMTTDVEVDNLNHQNLQVQGTCCVPDSQGDLKHCPLLPRGLVAKPSL